MKKFLLRMAWLLGIHRPKIRRRIRGNRDYHPRKVDVRIDNVAYACHCSNYEIREVCKALNVELYTLGGTKEYMKNYEAQKVHYHMSKRCKKVK